jgi:hypothetical protein
MAAMTGCFHSPVTCTWTDRSNDWMFLLTCRMHLDGSQQRLDVSTHLSHAPGRIAATTGCFHSPVACTWTDRSNDWMFLLTCHMHLDGSQQRLDISTRGARKHLHTVIAGILSLPQTGTRDLSLLMLLSRVLSSRSI